MTEELSRLKRGCRAFGLQLWPMVYPEKSPGSPRMWYIKITMCCLCDFEFLDCYIIIASCFHLYHPWYVLVVLVRVIDVLSLSVGAYLTLIGIRALDGEH